MADSEKERCSSCRQKKAQKVCGLCGGPVCKTCIQRLEPETFRYRDLLAEELRHEQYCAACYVRVVAPALAEYEAQLALARNVVVFTRKKSEETRRMSRSAKPIRVEGCADEAETLLKLAMLAVHDGHNVLLEVECTSAIVRHPGGYQTSRWRGSAIPSTVDPAWLARTENRR
jgi:hypothetical protein